MEDIATTIRYESTDLAENIGKGIVAGIIGTAAMTLAQMVEMELSKREPSNTPARAAEKVLDIKPVRKDKTEKLSNMMHWGYGASLGVLRGVLDSFRVNGWVGTLSHFAGVWGTAAIMLPKLNLAPPVKEWGGKEVAKDIMYHAIYAGVVGLVYDFLDDDEKH